MRRLGKGWRKPSSAQEPPQMPMSPLALSPTTPAADLGSQGAQTLCEDEPRLSDSWGTRQAQHTVGTGLPSQTREMLETLLPQAGQARRLSVGSEGSLAEWDPHW